MDTQQRLDRRRRAVLLQRANVRSSICEEAARVVGSSQQTVEQLDSPFRELTVYDVLLQRRLWAPNYLRDAAGRGQPLRWSATEKNSRFALRQTATLLKASTPLGTSALGENQEPHKTTSALGENQEPHSGPNGYQPHLPRLNLLHLGSGMHITDRILFQRLLSDDATHDGAAVFLQGCIRRLFALRGEFRARRRQVSSQACPGVCVTGGDDGAALFVVLQDHPDHPARFPAHAAAKTRAAITLQQQARKIIARHIAARRRASRAHTIAAHFIQQAFQCHRARGIITALRQHRAIKAHREEPPRVQRAQEGLVGEDVGTAGEVVGVTQAKDVACMQDTSDSASMQAVRVARQTVLLVNADTPQVDDAPLKRASVPNARSLDTETREEVVCGGEEEAVCGRGIGVARASSSPCAGGVRCFEAVAHRCVGGEAVPRSSRDATVTVLEIGGEVGEGTRLEGGVPRSEGEGGAEVRRGMGRLDGLLAAVHESQGNLEREIILGVKAPQVLKQACKQACTGEEREFGRRRDRQQVKVFCEQMQALAPVYGMRRRELTSVRRELAQLNEQLAFTRVEREVEEVADQVLRFKSHSHMVGKQLRGAARDGEDTRRSQGLHAAE